MSYLKYTLFVFVFSLLFVGCTGNDVSGLYSETDTGERLVLNSNGECAVSEDRPRSVHVLCKWELKEDGRTVILTIYDEHLGEPRPVERLYSLRAKYNPSSKMLHIESENLQYRKIE